MKNARIAGPLVALTTALVLGAGPAPARAGEDTPVVADILDVLAERGLIDEAEHERLAAKNAAWEAEQEGWMPAIEWSGDFRFRHESFWFDRDALGAERDNRYRIRYRFRLAGKARVNEWADIVFRLASGDNDQRSTNQTLGSGPDFDTDDIRLDLAFARLTAPAELLPVPNGKAVLELGKVPNPFVWDVGKDFMLWDHDITLEGASLRLASEPTDRVSLFANLGYYIDDENSRAKDPHFFAAQLGAEGRMAEDLTLGGRATWYEFRSVDAAFVGRQAGTGAVPDGLTGDVAGDQALRVVEAAAYLTWALHEAWPVTLYGDWARNLAAADSALFPGAADEDTAWGVGVEVGDKKRYVELGAGWWHIEANAFPSQLIDSDLFDGFTNREGFAVYGTRQLFRNTDLSLTVFVGDEIEEGLAFASSVGDAERVRMQADLKFKF